MNVFLNELRGPFFDFLVTNGDPWERAGRSQRITGIKQEYFHHSDALRVQDAIVQVVVSCFNESHPTFNYYGPTEFRNENLSELLESLDGWILQNQSRNTESDFRGLLPSYFLEEVRGVVDDWDEQWPIVRDELSGKIEEIRNLGRIAKRDRQTLLVLGV
jgi:hypothetical protein